jgi:hypothetical protein
VTYNDPFSRESMPPSKQTLAAKRLVNEETYRLQAKEAYEKHTASTGKLDILQRCKKLNEFLSTDFLKQGPENKGQLKEMLAILNSGPKRPSFLDKPPITASAGKKPATASTSSTSCTLNSVDAEKLLGFLSQEESAASRCNSDSSSSTRFNTTKQPEDVDDVIGLLNSAPSDSASKPSLRKDIGVQLEEMQGAESNVQELAEKVRLQVQKEEVQKLQQKQGEEQAQIDAKVRREEGQLMKREEEQRLKEEMEEETRRKKQEEAQRLQQKEDELRKLEVQRASALSRLQEGRNKAAVVIQRHVKGHLARIQVAAMKEKSQASAMLQSLYRALLSRRHLQELRVHEFKRRRAARCIASHFMAFKKKWKLGPLHEPVRGDAPSGLDSHAHLLNKPLRLRSLADARSAPEAAGTAGRTMESGVEDVALGASSSGRRAVACTWLRADHMMAQEDRLKDEVGMKALMVGSEHRSLQDAMHMAKGGSFGAKSVAASRGGSRPSSKGNSSR